MGLLVGQKSICHFLGDVSWSTVRRWIKEEGLPVIQRNGGLPRLLTEHVEEWQRDKLKKKQRR